MCVYIYCACLSCVYLCAHIYRVYVHTLDLYNGRTYIRVHPREATLCVVLARGANGCYQDAAGVFFSSFYSASAPPTFSRARRGSPRERETENGHPAYYISLPLLPTLLHIHPRRIYIYIYIIHTDVHLRSLARKANRI